MRYTITIFRSLTTILTLLSTIYSTNSTDNTFPSQNAVTITNNDSSTTNNIDKHVSPTFISGTTTNTSSLLADTLDSATEDMITTAHNLTSSKEAAQGGGDNATEAESGEDRFIIHQQQEIARRQAECFESHADEDTTDVEPNCPWTFDGWSCFNTTPAGSVAKVDCPGFILGFDVTRQGERSCWSNGSWFLHPDTKMPWTNYTKCVNLRNLQLHMRVNLVYVVGYSVSLVALTVSLTIFFCFKSLKCTRVSIHKNLFVSFLVNNILWVVWSAGVTGNTAVLENNQVWCQLLHILLHYFLVSTYFWMLCEGLYLHTLLVVTFVAEGRLLRCFLLLGWLLPVPFVVIYALFRSFDETATRHCWMEESNYNYFLSIPVVLSMFLNFIFLINIVRVLVTKLRAVNASPDHSATRKAVRATLILVPLLGLHYLLTPFRPPSGSAMEESYLMVSAVASSFQGFAVSLLFCFFNGEVLAVLRKKWRQNRLMRSPQSYAQATFSYKASMADGLTQVTTFNAAGDPEDV